MFRSEARTPGWVPVQQVELKTERVAIAFRALLTCAFVGSESEQNSSHLRIDRGRGPAMYADAATWKDAGRNASAPDGARDIEYAGARVRLATGVGRRFAQLLDLPLRFTSSTPTS
jgi:hypothetical protein